MEIPSEGLQGRRTSIVLSTVSMVLLALGLWGVWVNFSPTPFVDRVSFYASIVLALLATFFLFKKFGRNLFGYGAKRSRLAQAFIIVAIPLALFFMLRAALGYSIPSIITASVGERYAVDMVLEKKRGGGRRTCNYRLVGDAAKLTLLGHYCVGEKLYESLPNGSVKIAAFGRKSVLGEYFANFEYR